MSTKASTQPDGSPCIRSNNISRLSGKRQELAKFKKLFASCQWIYIFRLKKGNGNDEIWKIAGCFSLSAFCLWTWGRNSKFLWISHNFSAPAWRQEVRRYGIKDESSKRPSISIKSGGGRATLESGLAFTASLSPCTARGEAARNRCYTAN